MPANLYPMDFTCYYDGKIVCVEAVSPVQAIIKAAKRFKLRSPKAISGITAMSDNYSPFDNNKLENVMPSCCGKKK